MYKFNKNNNKILENNYVYYLSIDKLTNIRFLSTGLIALIATLEITKISYFMTLKLLIGI